MGHASLYYQILGCSLALLSAFFWAVGSLLFHDIGIKASAGAMNLVKCVIGCVYLGVFILIAGIRPVTGQAFLLLGVSGLLGIAFGDTFFFKALEYIGPKLTILLGTLGPVFTSLMAFLVLRERIPVSSLLGIFCVLGGVNMAVWKNSPEDKKTKNWKKGICFALLSSLSTALAIVLAKIGIETTESLQATFIRLFWAGGALLLWGSGGRKIGTWLQPFRDRHLFGLICATVLIVIFGGFWLSLVSLKYISASLSTILNFTTPIFILPLTALFLKEKITRTETAGAFIAVLGIALIFGTLPG